ncbi:MAG: hypothetical protein WKF63_02465, partial [Thermomicrobiales bacterium]
DPPSYGSAILLSAEAMLSRTHPRLNGESQNVTVLAHVAVRGPVQQSGTSHWSINLNDCPCGGNGIHP